MSRYRKLFNAQPLTMLEHDALLVLPCSACTHRWQRNTITSTCKDGLSAKASEPEEAQAYNASNSRQPVETLSTSDNIGRNADTVPYPYDIAAETQCALQ